MKRKGKVYIGTSGWHYKHWIGTFYPEGTKDSEQLAYYLKFFDTVELNNSFYHLPAALTFKNWKNATPRGFVFAVKGSRYITHMKKLKVLKSNLNVFFKRVDKLEQKTGPVLFQLPPKWNVNEERLDSFLKKLPEGHRYVFEFRNSTWYNENIYKLLSAHNCAFCIYELAGHNTPLITTANFIYVRLHGPGDKYQGSYTNDNLKKWARQCRAWQDEKKDVYVYFDNDQLGYAAFNAITLRQMLSKL
jgi:uncharacterized protein YecE (DUF72 family)